MDRLDALAVSLGELDSAGLALPQETTRVILTEAKRREWPFEQAWSAAVNRIQPSQAGGTVDMKLDSELREQRALLEEVRSYWRAAYEGTPLTTREAAESVASAWSRTIDGPVPEHYQEHRGDSGHRPHDVSRHRRDPGAAATRSLQREPHRQREYA